MTRIILPAASPLIFAGLRKDLSIAIILMVISEMFVSSNGIGFAIVQFQRRFALPKIWFCIIVLGILGVILSAIFCVNERKRLS